MGFAGFRARFLVAFCSLFLACGLGLSGETIVIDEDFEDLAIDGNLLNNAQIVDYGDGRSTILSLTQGQNDQSGFAWFQTPFNLRDNRVEIEFDLWIRPGSSATPADGLSVIFQFGDDINATGGGGGGLGTSNFPYEYVSVAFDIWDNGGADPETQCDDATPHTCHVEVNQNSPDPGTAGSVQTNIDFGVQVPDFTAVGATLTPIEVKIVFDNGRIQVTFRTDGDPNFTDPVLVLDTVLADFPADANAIIGFAASTGGANAHHEIDNLRVVTSEATPQVNVTVELGNGERGAINCGSSEELTGTVNGETYTFVPDVAYGGFLGTDTTVIPNENQFAGYGYTSGQNPAGPVPDTIENVGDPNLMGVYQTERWDNGAVAYKFNVKNGRFEVNLHFAEICPACGVSPDGEATRRVHVTVEGERVLSFWSSALAAGNEAGEGPKALTAVIRTYQVDVTDGVLDVVISDLGLLGTPPENAQINGISYRRIGDATGEPVSGQIEDFGPPLLPKIQEVPLVDTDFEDDDVGACPADWQCNDNGVFTPQVVDTSDLYGLSINQRFRLSDVSGGIATASFYTTPADLTFQGFEAEFTVYLTQPSQVCVADGLTFFFLPGDETVLGSIGGTGGSLGYHGIGTSGFAVEIDTYQGTGDPGGIPQSGNAHVGLVVNGDVTQHVQTNVALNPYTVAPDWPLALDDTGQFLIGTLPLEENEEAGLRVRVELNGGRFRVWIKTVNENPDDGFVYPEQLVIDTLTDYGVTGLGPGYFGFSAGTGGCQTYHEIDDLKITLFLSKPVSVTRSIPVGTAYSDSSSRIPVTIHMEIAPEGGPQDVIVKENLPDGWSAEDISDGGTVADSVITWNLTNLTGGKDLTYTLIPSDATKQDVSYTGTFTVGGFELPIEGRAFLLWSPPPLPKGPANVVLDENFDDQNGCPAGWTCNTNDAVYSPGVPQDGTEHAGRLQLAADATPNLATTVIWNTPIDLSSNSFLAEFDLYFASDPAVGNTNPADGLTFMILEDLGDDTLTALGAGGGSLAYAGMTTQGGVTPRSLAVEFDLWQGGGDPNGYNTAGYGHAGVLRDADVANHVQTNLDLDPGTTPTVVGGEGWPYFVDQLGAGFPLHVEIEYNNGRVKVYLDAPETYASDGSLEPAFDRRLILDTAVTFPDSDGDGVPDVLSSAYIGFSAGTGGADAFHEIDNLRITLYPAEGGGELFSRGDANDDGARNIADAVFILQYLFGGGGEPPCPDAADANDDGGLNIADAVAILQHLFGGGGDLPAPFPGCGTDPTDDNLGPCVSQHCK